MKFRKRNFTALIGFCIILILGPLVYFGLINPRKTIASWFDDKWRYRVAISITNNSTFSGTNVPYKYIFDTATPIAASKMQASGNDIRVVDRDGKIIRHQVEQSTLNTTTTGLWFEASIPAKTAVIYYIYYGNSSASALTFNSDVESDDGGTTVEMNDGFGYTTDTYHARVSDIRLNDNNLGVNGNYHYTSIGYPGNWWDDRAFTKTALASGPLFSEVKYEDTNYGNYSSLGTNIKMFANGFVEVRVFMNYNTDTNELLYYYLHFDSGTRNSLWVNASETLVDQAADSPTLYQSDLHDNWFGQRWTDTGNYGGTIITKNNSDWNNGVTSAQASYYQTNYTYTEAYTNGSSRQIRYGIFAGQGTSAAMNQKASLLGDYSVTAAAEEVGRSPVTYWKFDEGVGTTVYDSSVSRNNGSITGATWQTEDQCISGKCLYFDGTADNVAMSKSIALSTQFTISHWLKTTASGGQTYTVGNAGSGNGYRFGIGSGKVAFLIGNAGGFTETTCGTKTVNDNQWHLITGVFSSASTFSCYIDGRFEASVNIVNFSGMNTGAPGIGAPPCCTDYQGYIDEPKIYPYARTAAEIKQDYNLGSAVIVGHQLGTAQITPLTSKLVGHWKFDEGYGTTIHNSIQAQSQYVGTMYNIMSWSNNGKFGKAISFDGTTAQLIISNSSDQRYNGGDRTWSLWLNPDPSDDGSWVISKPWNGSGQYNYHLDSSGGSNPTLSFTILGATSWGINSVKTISANSWHHIVVTINGTTKLVSFYLDGVLTNSAAHNITDWTPGSGDGNANVVLGCIYPYGSDWCAGSTGYAYKGLMDEFKIYNYALTADEVKLDYNRGSSTVMGSLSSGTGNTAPSNASSQEYCVPGDTAACSPPVDRWDFEEGVGSSAFDSSGNGNVGSWNGTGTHWETGKQGKAGKFNGSDDYVISDSLMSSPNTETLSFWVYPQSSGVVVSELGQQTIDSGYHYTKVGLNTNNELKGNFWSCNENLSFGTIGFNQWYFVTLIYDGSAEKAYLNGQFIDSYTCARSAPGTQYLAFAATDSQTGGGFDDTGYFQGKIDQVRIYNYARSPAQVAWDYNKGAPVAQYKFDECQGTTAYNSSSRNYDGIITIGASGSQNTAGTCSLGVGQSSAWANGATGKYNSSLNFDGTDDYVGINAISGLTSVHTTSLWIKPTTVANGNYYLFDTGTANNNWIQLYDGDGDGKLELRAGSIGSVGYYISYSNFEFTQSGNWYHIVVTTDDAKLMTIYINGIFDKSQTLTGVQTPGAIKIGVAGSNSQFFPGQIDDVQIYNYALTAAQVKLLYNANSAVQFGN